MTYQMTTEEPIPNRWQGWALFSSDKGEPPINEGMTSTDATGQPRTRCTHCDLVHDQQPGWASCLDTFIRAAFYGVDRDGRPYDSRELSTARTADDSRRDGPGHGSGSGSGYRPRTGAGKLRFAGTTKRCSGCGSNTCFFYPELNKHLDDYLDDGPSD